MTLSIKSPYWYPQADTVLRSWHSSKHQDVDPVSDLSDIYVSLNELLALKSAATYVDLKKLPLSQSHSAGDARSNSHGGGIEFDEVRPYQAGDDIRRIDWRVSARTGRPLTKLFREEREHAVYVAVDQRPTMFFGSQSLFKSVYAAKLASIAIWSALLAGDRCGGVICADTLHTFRSARSRRTILQMLDALSRYNKQLNADSQSLITLADCIDNCQLHARAGSTVLIISDFYDCDDDTILKLRNLARQRLVILACISDPVEQRLPMRGPTGISNGRTGSVANINAKFNRQFIAERNAWKNRLTEAANNGGVLLAQLSTTDNINALFSLNQNAHAQRKNKKRKQVVGS